MSKTTRTTMSQLQKMIRPVIRAKNQLSSVVSFGPDDASEYTIDQLAMASKSTVRTIEIIRIKGSSIHRDYREGEASIQIGIFPGLN